jgi:hypothetical protein
MTARTRSSIIPVSCRDTRSTSRSSCAAWRKTTDDEGASGQLTSGEQQHLQNGISELGRQPRCILNISSEGGPARRRRSP